MKSILCLINLLTMCQSVLFTGNNVPNWGNLHVDTRTAGREVYLTPHIDVGDDFGARKLAYVDRRNFYNMTSYSGYLTVNKEYNSNLFFWFFPAKGTYHLYEENTGTTGDKSDWSHENKPLILWLQGGPGSSSLFGLFHEIGPFSVTDDGLNITKNPYSWHESFSLIFIDNPVGAGFSFTNDYRGYASKVDQIAKTIIYWFAGESFAGKYIPTLGFEIHTKNKEQHFKINLQGLLMGNAFSDPYNSIDYSDFLYQTGLIDDHGKAEMEILEIVAKENINKPDGREYWDSIISMFFEKTGYDNLYNILHPTEPLLDAYQQFINQSHIREALHVGNIEFSPPFYVYHNLSSDFMTSVMNFTEKLLDENLRIMYYNGILDFIVAYPLSENSFKNMHWSGSKDYLYAKRKTFIVDNKISGYIKTAKNFTEVVVLNAGHMVPYDQPKVMFELIKRFIYKKL